MPDLKKVIKGLEQCISVDETCTGCPYEGTVCTTTLNSDALTLLKEQDKLIKLLGHHVEQSLKLVQDIEQMTGHLIEEGR